MNPDKQHKKLLKVMSKACDCDSREQARKLIKKADKINNKLDGISSKWVRSSTSIDITDVLLFK